MQIRLKFDYLLADYPLWSPSNYLDLAAKLVWVVIVKFAAIAAKSANET